MNKHKQPHSIGMFDSGVGGLTVMQQIMRTLPHEHIVYFGDTARVPYGEKSPETIIRYSLEIARFLMENNNIKALVVACNTVSSCSLDELQKICKAPVIGVIEPGAEKAVEVTRNGRIAVLGTRRTIASGAYEKEILQRLPKAFVIGVACPLLTPLVEEHFITHNAAKMIVREYLAPLHDQNIDTVLLGCTHYPLLRPLIEAELGPQVTIVDSAQTCAERVAAILKNKRMEASCSAAFPHKYFVSDDPERFRTLGKTFLGMELEPVEMRRLL